MQKECIRVSEPSTRNEVLQAIIVRCHVILVHVVICENDMKVAYLQILRCGDGKHEFTIPICY